MGNLPQTGTVAEDVQKPGFEVCQGLFVVLPDPGTNPIDQISIGHTGGTGYFTGPAAEASVEVRPQARGWPEFFAENCLDQGNAPSGGIGFIGELQVGWAMRQTETAFYTAVSLPEQWVRYHRLSERVGFFMQAYNTG